MHITIRLSDAKQMSTIGKGNVQENYVLSIRSGNGVLCARFCQEVPRLQHKISLQMKTVPALEFSLTLQKIK